MKLIKSFTNQAHVRRRKVAVARAEKLVTAFTFVELLVVLAVIVILALLLLPAVASTTGSSLRIQCLNNLRQLGMGLTVYANDNHGLFVPPKPADNDNTIPSNPPFVQIAIFSRYTNALIGAGIPLGSSNAPSLWCCPDIPDLPYPDTQNYPQWIIGYQYLGGITQWTPGGTTGVIPGTHSPVKLTQCKPYWCLAADLVAKINGTWGGTWSLDASPIQASEKTWPPHREGTNAIPVGGNEVFADGSASWCRVETMHNFTSWTANNQMWFYQSMVDLNFGAKVTYNSLSYRWNGGN